MKTRNSTLAKLLTSLMLALATAPALAQDDPFSQFGPALAQLAQYYGEDRRVMRERWEQAGPEERLRMRREFVDRMRQMPPDIMPGPVDPRRGPSNRDRASRVQPDDASFGFGFERRRYGDERYESQEPGYTSGRGYDAERDRNRDSRRGGRR